MIKTVLLFHTLSINQDEVPEKAIEEAVMEAIKEEEGKHRMISMEMSRFVIYLLNLQMLLIIENLNL